MRPRRWCWRAALFLLVALLAAACGGAEEEPSGGDGQAAEFPAGSTMAMIQDKGEIVIGVKYDVAPFGFENPQSGNVEGFDVDMGNIIAEELGVEAKFTEAITDNRIPFLQDGTVDIILSTMTITTDRGVEVDFSRPYFIAHGRVLVPKGSDISSIEDLGGTKVCTGLGSTYESTIEDKAPDADLKLVESYSECFENIQNGSVDAVSTDDVILTGMIIQDDSLELVGDRFTVEPYGAGIPDGDKEFADFVSGVIEDTFASGQWDGLYQKWVGKYTGEEADHPEGFELQDAYKLFPCEEFCKEAKKEPDIQ